MDFNKIFKPHNTGTGRIKKQVYYKSFKKLTKKQINEIIELVNMEAAKSKEFGFFIKPEDLQSEITATLIFIDYLGGVDIAKILLEDNWDRYLKSFMYYLRSSLIVQVKYYFEITPRGKTRTWYNVHLENVAAIVARYAKGDISL